MLDERDERDGMEGAAGGLLDRVFLVCLVGMFNFLLIVGGLVTGRPRRFFDDEEVGGLPRGFLGAGSGGVRGKSCVRVGDSAEGMETGGGRLTRSRLFCRRMDCDDKDFILKGMR